MSPPGAMVRSEVGRVYEETDPRVLRVLERALRSSSRTVRLRAVCMLANVSCTHGRGGLWGGCGDCYRAGRPAAAAVACWTAAVEPAPWPQREDPMFDRVSELVDADELLEAATGLAWEWEYAVEVWREDGLLVGVFLCTTCQEDPEHAKKIALGQAVLASTGESGERFEPSTAAAFVVARRQVRRGPRRSRGRGSST